MTTDVQTNYFNHCTCSWSNKVSVLLSSHTYIPFCHVTMLLLHPAWFVSYMLVPWTSKCFLTCARISQSTKLLVTLACSVEMLLSIALDKLPDGSWSSPSLPTCFHSPNYKCSLTFCIELSTLAALNNYCLFLSLDDHTYMCSMFWTFALSNHTGVFSEITKIRSVLFLWH